MPINSSCSAWRTKPCKFFAETGACTKGAECRFAHIDEGGNDVHEYFDPSEQSFKRRHGEQKQEGPSEDYPHIYLDENGEMEEPCGEEVNMNEVGAMAEPCEEGEKGVRLQPHFGIFEGIGP